MTEPLSAAVYAELRDRFDWSGIWSDLARTAVVCDGEVSRVLGEETWRGATDEEIHRIVSILVAHYHPDRPPDGLHCGPDCGDPGHGHPVFGT